MIVGELRLLNDGVAMDWTQGDNGVPGRLGDDGFFASKKYVEDHQLRLGSPIALEFPSGKKVSVRLKGVWKEPQGGSPFANVSISTELLDKYVPRPQDLMVLINMPGGVSDANTATLKRDVKNFADAKVQTRDEFKSNFEAPINKLLNLLYALLALSVFAMRLVPRQFFPPSDRPELLVNLTLPQSAAIYATERSSAGRRRNTPIGAYSFRTR